MQKKKYRILLADDHQAITEGMRHELEKELDCLTIHTVSNDSSLFYELKQEAYDMLFLDYELGTANAVETLPKVRLLAPDIRIVIYTMHDKPWIIMQLIKFQVNGILIKGESLDDLPRAVESVLFENENYYSKVVYTLLLSQAGDNCSRSKLTYAPSPREREIINLLSEGYTSEKIAQKLFLSKNTVETMRKNILSKSGALNVSHLIRMAFLNTWIE